MMVMVKPYLVHLRRHLSWLMPINDRENRLQLRLVAFSAVSTSCVLLMLSLGVSG